MIFKHLSKLFLALCMCALIGNTSCSEKVKNEKRQNLRVNIGTEPPSLDSRRAYDLTSSIVLKMLNDGLTRLNPNGKSRPSVAHTISVTEDLKSYTFKLRESYWTNGDRVTAQDFEYAWKWILDPRNQADFAYQLFVIKNARDAKLGKAPMSSVGIHAIDESTLVVDLENPTPYFLELTCLMVYYPVNKKVEMARANLPADFADKNEVDSFVTNGPFKMASWEHSSEIVLEKFQDYWDAGTVKLEQINLYMIPDPNTELSMFEENELDWAGTPLSLGLPSDAIPKLKESGKLHIKPESATYFYTLNTDKTPLNNLKLRRALAYAIDRKSIVDNITQANQIPALGLLPPPLALQSGPYFPDHDVKGARALFEEALSELKLTKENFPPITLSYNTSENHSKIAQAVQQQINEVLGIKIVLDNLEWQVYLDKLHNRDFEMGRMSWIADFNDPIAFLEPFKYKTNSTNNTGWESPKYIELLDEASREGNYKKRLDLLHQAEQILMDEMPIIPVYFLMNSYLKNPKLQNVFLSGLGDIDFKWAYFEP